MSNRVGPDGPVSSALEGRLGVVFSDPALLRTALSHRSVAGDPQDGTYERLEFLGDAVVGFVVAEWLYGAFPDLPEGELSRRKALLVSEAVLADAAERLDIGPHIIVGSSMDSSQVVHHTSLHADVFEALVGAVLLDRGVRTARALVRRALAEPFREVEGAEWDHDAKTRLQELTQARWRCLPHYEVCRSAGPDHRPVFTVTVSVMGRRVGEGSGKSKKSGAQLAARDALANVLTWGE